MDKNTIPQVQNVNKPLVCFECGSPVNGLYCYLEFLSPNASPKDTDAWGQYVYYLKLCDNCYELGHRSRVIRLGDVIAQLGTREDAVSVEQIREGLAQLAAHIETHGAPTADPASRIVYQLVAGQITPDAAIAEIRELCHFGVLGALETEPEFHWQEQEQ